MNSYRNKLDERGFFVKENFLSIEELTELKSFFENKFKSNKTPENTFKFDNEKLFRFDCLKKLKKKLNKFLHKELSINFHLRNIWMIETKENNIKNDLPYVCHIDKKRYLKVFIYLNNVGLNDGPFTVALNSSPKKNEKIRLNWWNKNKDDPVGGKHGLLINDDNLEYKAMSFNQGTLICFDTNTPHYAGIVKMNGCRQVLRFNYFSTFNDRFDLGFEKMKLKSNLIGFKNRVLQ